MAQSIEVEGRFNCLSNNTNKIKQIKQGELNDDNEKLYQTLKNAPATIRKNELERHSQQFLRVRHYINNSYRR